MVQVDKTDTILVQVQVGMPVYDANNQRIGAVTDMFPGVGFGDRAESDSAAPATNPEAHGEQHAADVVPDVPAKPANTIGTFGAKQNLPGFAFESEIPESVRPELIANGFLRLDRAGIKGIARYITPDQIAFVQEGGVHLNISSDKLVKA